MASRWKELTFRAAPAGEEERPLWPDVLKIVSIYAVILIHSAAPFLVRRAELGPGAWWAGNLYDSASRWCIPLFFMLSGTFLLEKAGTMPLSAFLRGRVRRVLVPFVVWSLVYFLWRIRIQGEELPLASFPLLLFTGPLYYHLWYLYVLIGLYLFAPALGAWLKGASGPQAGYFVGLWFLFACLLPLGESWWGFEGYLSTGTAPSLFKYAGFFVLGHLLRRTVLRPTGMAQFAGLFLLALAATAWCTWYGTVVRNGGDLEELFFEYFSPNVVAMALSVYLFGKSLRPPRRALAARAVRAIAACVPGIYLVHALLIGVSKRGLLGFRVDPSDFAPAVGIPLFALGVFAASFVVVYAVRSLPLVRRAFP
ncbi:MAG: acyltransferase family protein [Deltaproteobacteria bacterium]|nr:acyltransferase family protein [Deltaproteobacteria bacterium]